MRILDFLQKQMNGLKKENPVKERLAASIAGARAELSIAQKCVSLGYHQQAGKHLQHAKLLHQDAAERLQALQMKEGLIKKNLAEAIAALVKIKAVAGDITNAAKDLFSHSGASSRVVKMNDNAKPDQA